MSMTLDEVLQVLKDTKSKYKWKLIGEDQLIRSERTTDPLFGHMTYHCPLTAVCLEKTQKDYGSGAAYLARQHLDIDSFESVAIMNAADCVTLPGHRTPEAQEAHKQLRAKLLELVSSE